VQTFRETEYLFSIFGFNSDALVFNEKMRHLSVRQGRDVNAWNIFAPIFNGISDEALEKLTEMHFAHEHER